MFSAAALAAVAAAASCAACASSGAAAATTPADAEPGVVDAADDRSPVDDASAALGVSVHAVVDLPRTTATEALSGTAFDPATRTLYALQDKRTRIVPLVGNEAFDAFTVGTPIVLTGRTEIAYDGEGLVLSGAGFIAVTNETTPTVERFDLSGKREAAIALPPRYGQQAAGNKGLESLAVSPSGAFLFTANESALMTDGSVATKTRGTTVRILRRELATGADSEVAYRTEPLGAGGVGDMGVAELAAVSDDVLLVLERGYQADYGNTVRIFRVDFSSGSRVDGIPALTAATPVLEKTLLVDIATLPPSGATHPATQPNPILDNYEALSIGPTLPDGRRLLFVTSDDNASATQVPRVLVLAVRGL